jgi:hypothetical protein
MTFTRYDRSEAKSPIPTSCLHQDLKKKENKKIIPKELLLQFSVIYYKGLEKRFELSDREVCWRNFTLLYLQGENMGESSSTGVWFVRKY